MEASEKCNFVVYCYQLAAPDCLTFKGDRGGVCTWNTILAECQNPASQPWVTSKVTSSEIVGCRFFQTSFDCSRASPIDPSSGCMWYGGLCVDVDGSKPSRMQQTCRKDYVIDQAQDKTIVDSISQIQEVAESYHANSTTPGGPTPSSLDLTQYLARQLEANWTLTAATCESLSSALLQVNLSAAVCGGGPPQCDSDAQWRLWVHTTKLFCEKIKNAHLAINQSSKP